MTVTGPVYLQATDETHTFDRLLLASPDSTHHARLLEWARQTPGADFWPDFHRLQVEYWVTAHVLQETQRYPGSLLRVLDVGAYVRRSWLPVEYWTFGPEDCAPDIVGDLLDPVAARVVQVWDVILCTEVLEHCADPIAAMRQLHGLLRPGGLLIATSPFFWPDHRTEDYPDYWRFTEQGWRLLLKNFEDVQVVPCDWTQAGAALYDVLRQHEGWGWRTMTQASTGYNVTGRRPAL